MTQYIDKAALVVEIESKRKYAQTLGNNAINSSMQQFYDGMKQGCVDILSFLDTLEVKEINSIVNPYDACIQYTDRESAIKAHAEDYSWNIESELFQQLTPEQQKLWRKEIEQAVISGGYSGLSLAKDRRYDTLEVKKVDLEKEIKDYFGNQPVVTRSKGVDYQLIPSGENIAKHFFELGMSVSNKAQKREKV